MEELLPLTCTKIVSSRAQVECCRFSPKGDIIAACLSDGSVRLYDIWVTSIGLEKAKLKHQFKEHKSNVWCISFSNDGLHFSSCSSDHSVIIYSLANLQVVQILHMHADTVWCCIYSPLSLLATGSQDCTVKICNPQEDYALKHTLGPFQCPVVDISFNARGNRLCTCTSGGEVTIWHVDDQSNSHPTGLHVFSDAARICKFVCLEGQDYIITSREDNSLSLLDITDGDGRDATDIVTAASTCMQPDSCNGKEEGTIVNIVTGSSKNVQTFSGHHNIVWSCCLLQSSVKTSFQLQVLVTCAGDRTIR